jgi:putative tryptophan/tyrosine transport system substrate-binding protein
VSKVALLVNPNDRDSARRYIDEAQRAAEKLQLALHPFEVRAPADLASAFSKMRDNQINGVVVSQDGLSRAKTSQIWL